MARAGLDNFLIGNELVGWEKLRRLAELARKTNVLVAVDSSAGGEALPAAAG